MSNVSAGIIFDPKDQAWFTANAAIVFDNGITIYCNEAPNKGQYKLTDGVTALGSISFSGGSGGSQNLDDVLTEGNDGGANQIKNILDPTDDQDAATKKYVDDNAGGASIIVYHSGTNTTPITGTTANTIASSVLIPANTYANGDRLRMNLRVVKTGLNDTYSIRIYSNNSASLSGATLLNQLNGSSPHEMFFIVNNWVFKTASLMQRFTPFVPLPYDEGQGGISLPPENFAFDTTIDQYLIFAIQNANTSDSTVYSDITIEKY